MSNDKYINPELPGGFRDYLPENMIVRQAMCDKIRGVFERFGFLPLDTPGIEKTEVLTGGDANFRMHMFNVSLNGEDEDLALRFDLTVPLARVMSQYSEQLQKPFKRYQMGKVWRGERSEAGRFKEFMQFYADILGFFLISADCEKICFFFLIYDTF